MTRATMMGLREELRKAIRNVSMAPLRLNNCTVQMGISAVSGVRYLNGRGTEINDMRRKSAYCRDIFFESHWKTSCGERTSAQLIM